MKMPLRTRRSGDPNQKNLPTAEEINTLAKPQQDDVPELQRLEVLLAHDPSELAGRCRRAQSALGQFAKQISAAAVALSPDQAATLATLQDKARTTAEASTLAAGARFASEPLKDVGLEPWRLMYDYAKVYAEAIGASMQKVDLLHQRFFASLVTRALDQVSLPTITPSPPSSPDIQISPPFRVTRRTCV